jgi:hypothetical protein
MVISKSVFISINCKEYKKYRNLGYKFEKNEMIEVKLKDLSLKSHALVEAKCDICGFEKKIKYQVYNKNYEKYNYYSCSIKCAMGKYIQNNLNKYGVDNYSKTDECKKKMKETCLKKYGSISPSGNVEVMNKIINTRIERGIQNSNRDIDDYKLYKKLVRKLTDISKKVLLENWNGYDFYDNEYIKDNFKLNPNNRLYPTIDHKVSVYYGYNNNISAEYISSVDNLCLTKRGINSSKNIKTDEIFRKL